MDVHVRPRNIQTKPQNASQLFFPYKGNKE